jgi:hypothetical protein
MGATMQPTSMSSLPPGAILPNNHQVAAAAAAAAAALSRPGLFSQLQQPVSSDYVWFLPLIRFTVDLSYFMHKSLSSLVSHEFIGYYNFRVNWNF